MSSADIRKSFLEFFRSKGHKIVASDLLVPASDPTLLFTSAGMNQFKEQFLGHNVTYRKAASSQKCLRTADLDKVGKTPSHHTFFEMLGNFSFGNYFKKEAILWAWEFLTETLKIKEGKLWASVYKDDEESYAIWKDSVKVPSERIVKLGAGENFWPSNAPKNGPNGPCGPCSEIFYDWGKDTGCGKKGCNPSCSCGRFVEVWNLVFTQHDRKDGGRLESLPNKNIDTGMGLERITAVMQKVKTNFETDIFTPIINKIKKHNPKLKTESLNAIADHARAVTFAICDGVAPSNEERGYVIRKLIRRAYLRGEAKKPYLYNVIPKVVEIMNDVYPELLAKREEISLIVKEEEEKFRHTLSTAMPILEEDLKTAKGRLLDGNKIFKLVDTYGLPLEIIEGLAKKGKIKLDIKGFHSLMDKRKEISRKKSKIEEDIFALNMFAKAPTPACSEKMPLKTKIAFMVKGKKVAGSAFSGDVIEVMTDPQSVLFYTEAGGQVGDTGELKTESAALRISNTVRIDDKTIHVAEVVKGQIAKGDIAELTLDITRKDKIAKNHTATHLLHSALRKVLGNHVHQAGSAVDENRLRFDFTHMKKLSEREFEEVESIVNNNIKKAIPLKKRETTLNEAKKEGAIALFGEKYGAKVKVISAGDFSKEVCGGTHVDNTKDIEFFKIIRESSVASGVRRIEALTSKEASMWLEESEKLAREKEKFAKKKEKEAFREKEKLKGIEAGLKGIIENAEDIKGKKIIVTEMKGANLGILRKLADKIKSAEKIPFVMLASEDRGKVNLVLALGDEVVSKGYNASIILKDVAKVVDGSGGGRADFAQAGGKDPSKLNAALEIARKSAAEIIEGVSK